MSNRKLHFFTSDWHIGHANVLVYDKRPFANLEEMHAALVRNFNAMVPTGSVTYFLGDMGMVAGEALKNIVGQLNGTKVLVVGNHDAGINKMYSMGFDVVIHGAVLYIAQHRVTLSHCPLLDIRREETEGMKGSAPGENWHGESRHGRFTFAPGGQDFHLHGHIHSPNGGKSQRILGNQFDVGVAANGYRPVSISHIESWITKTVSLNS